MTFTTAALTGERVLVQGTDQFGVSNKVVLDATEWNSVKRELGITEAQKDFDQAVNDFYAPLIEAAEAAKSAFTVPTHDEDSTVVLVEGTEGVTPVRREIRTLGHDSVVLRILEQGDHSRLVWVGDGLEVLAVLPGTNPAPAATPEVHEDTRETGLSTADGPFEG